MPEAHAEFVQVRGLRLRLRTWGDAAAPRLVLLHGFMDTAETFAPLIAPLLDVVQVIAPDQRGFGDSDRAPHGYWFADYVADLDALLAQLSPQDPVWLAGHSMGAQVASLYAGLRPERVSRLICLDGPSVPDILPDQALQRFRQWLDQQQAPLLDQAYEDFATLGARIARLHPRLDAADCLRIARCWARETGQGIELRSDPRHRHVLPVPHRAADSMAIWREVRARTCFIDGGRSPVLRLIDAGELAARRACFADHQVRVIADAGHMLHFDAPAETAAQMLEFLKNCE